MRVECDVEETVVEHQGRSVTGIIVTCLHCEREVSVPGRDLPETRRRALRLLHAKCPHRILHQFYFTDQEQAVTGLNLNNEFIEQ